VNDFSMIQPTLQGRIKSRSMGVKLIVVCGLALLMTIPAFFVNGLVDDRTKRAADVTKEISGHVGGPQTFLGPTLAIPYSVPPQSPVESAKHGIYLVFPAQRRPASEVQKHLLVVACLPALGDRTAP
jgi:inner membrane protein